MQEIFRENLIISVDDFGISQKANENILQLLRVGKVDRVSVMIDGDFSKEDIRELLDSQAKLDLHLSIGKSQDWKNCSPKKSAFLRAIHFLGDYFSRKHGKLEIMKDWERQTLLFQKKFGRFPDGLNSHEHLHFFPPYFQIASRLAKKHGIKYLRFGKGGIVRSKKINSAVAFILSKLWKVNFSYFKRNFTPSSDFLLSFDWMKNPLEFLDILNERVKVEIIFHPEREKENSFILRNL